jgi:hypothetical protein
MEIKSIKAITTQNNAGKYIGIWSAYLFSFVLNFFGKESAFYWQNLFSDLETLKSLRMLNLLNTF